MLWTVETGQPLRYWWIDSGLLSSDLAVCCLLFARWQHGGRLCCPGTDFVVNVCCCKYLSSAVSIVSYFQCQLSIYVMFLFRFHRRLTVQLLLSHPAVCFLFCLLYCDMVGK